MENELLQAAIAARNHAYMPYSGFAVGAAVLTDDGSIYTGCNVENASYGLTCCAERTAIFKSISEGRRTFTQIAIVADTKGPCSPCGMCRQVMVEFFPPEAKVILGNLNGDVKVTTVQDLLPLAFEKGDLDERRI